MSSISREGRVYLTRKCIPHLLTLTPARLPPQPLYFQFRREPRVFPDVWKYTAAIIGGMVLAAVLR